MKQKIINEILKQLEGMPPSEQDKSVMIKLTPLEIFNIAKMGATYWNYAEKCNTPLTIDDVCHHHVDIAIAILKQTDPERFENRS